MPIYSVCVGTVEEIPSYRLEYGLQTASLFLPGIFRPKVSIHRAEPGDAIAGLNQYSLGVGPLLPGPSFDLLLRFGQTCDVAIPTNHSRVSLVRVS